MLRRSVRALEVLLEQPSAQPAMLLLKRGGVSGGNTMAQASRQVWRRPAARTIATTPTPARPAARSFQSPSTLFARAPRRTFHSSRARRSQEGKASAEAGEGAKTGSTNSTNHSLPAEKLSMSQRIKKLSREYGWTAVGVYFGLSLLDFPFCFLLVRTLGTDKIAAAEEFVVSHVKKVIPESVKERYRKYRAALKEAKKESGADAVLGGGEAPEAPEGWGVEEAELANKHEASLATQLALAYAIHKSFIFVRVPLAAAVTPKVVKVLRSWGWKIGKKPKKA